MKPGKDFIGVGVFALVFNKEDEVLLVKSVVSEKKSKEYEDVWSMPGGTVEFGESCLDALRREIGEETGLNIGGERLINYNVEEPRSEEELAALEEEVVEDVSAVEVEAEKKEEGEEGAEGEATEDKKEE